MKVIQSGLVTPKEWKQRVRCQNCTALLEIETIDVRWVGTFVPEHPHDVEGKLVGEDFVITCPECKTDTVVAIPTSLANRLRPMML